MMRVHVSAANVPANAVLELWDGATLIGLVPNSMEVLIPAASLGAHAFIARVVDNANTVLATSNTWDVTVVLPTPTINAILDNYTPPV